MKLPFWATIFTILGVIILCWLGFWQLARSQWKTEILNAIEAEYAIDASRNVLSSDDLAGGSDFKRGFLFGRYHHDKEIFIQARTHKGTPGYHVLTPFQLVVQKDDIVLVNRGWVPIEQEMPKNSKINRPESVFRIVGMLRAVPAANSFVPENQPDQDMWYRIDLNQIGDVKEINFASPNVFYVENEVRSLTSDLVSYPVSAATKVRPKNNHVQYMFFWFTMAVALIIIYVIRFMIPQRHNHS